MLKSKAKKSVVNTIMNPDTLCKAVKKNPKKYPTQLRKACIGSLKPKEVKPKKKRGRPRKTKINIKKK